MPQSERGFCKASLAIGVIALTPRSPGDLANCDDQLTCTSKYG
jgi:hypothetical protein